MPAEIRSKLILNQQHKGNNYMQNWLGEVLTKPQSKAGSLGGSIQGKGDSGTYSANRY